MTIPLERALELDVVESADAYGSLFRFATAGSVDDGKSTLVGRLLHDSKAILVDHLDAVSRTSKERGFGGTDGGIDLALLTDGLRAEREQGITIDVAYRYFATDSRSFILADCPGHVQYTRNMVTGATTADAVIVLVDARNGVLEQTRRHLSVISLLRVPHLIVAINKIDLVGFDADRFASVVAEVEAVTSELGIDDVYVIPVSALGGDNVVDRSANTPWYNGPSLIELLELLPTTAELEQDSQPLRLPVQLVLRPQGALATDHADSEEFRDYRAYAGQLATGTVSVGDRVSVHPGNTTTTVTRIDVAGRREQSATAPQSVALSLADAADLARGAVIAAVGTLAEPRSVLAAELFWLDPRRTSVGARVLLKWGTALVQARIQAIAGRRDLETLAIAPTTGLESNDIGAVTLQLSEALPVEPYSLNRRTGSFLLIDPQDGATLAAGIVSDEG